MLVSGTDVKATDVTGGHLSRYTGAKVATIATVVGRYKHEVKSTTAGVPEAWVAYTSRYCP